MPNDPTENDLDHTMWDRFDYDLFYDPESGLTGDDDRFDYLHNPGETNA